jgi:hypothetical protein
MLGNIELVNLAAFIAFIGYILYTDFDASDDAARQRLALAIVGSAGGLVAATLVIKKMKAGASPSKRGTVANDSLDGDDDEEVFFTKEEERAEEEEEEEEDADAESESDAETEPETDADEADTDEAGTDDGEREEEEEVFFTKAEEDDEEAEEDEEEEEEEEDHTNPPWKGKPMSGKTIEVSYPDDDSEDSDTSWWVVEVISYSSKTKCHTVQGIDHDGEPFDSEVNLRDTWWKFHEE